MSACSRRMRLITKYHVTTPGENVPAIPRCHKIISNPKYYCTNDFAAIATCVLLQRRRSMQNIVTPCMAGWCIVVLMMVTFVLFDTQTLVERNLLTIRFFENWLSSTIISCTVCVLSFKDCWDRCIYQMHIDPSYDIKYVVLTPCHLYKNCRNMNKVEISRIN
uniref:Uncharacterized protein n=1 Tax=Glossina pallidipes TaxID=7398 RepID=A0A1A9ZJT2_GLOPL